MPTTYAIPNGATEFAASTWTGDSSSSRAITNGGNNPTGVTFQPDFVWLKNRTAAYTSSNALYDSVRGAGSAYLLVSNNTNAEGTANAGNLYGYLSAFNSNGFTAAKGSTDAGYLNQSPDTYVGWQWKAGGAAVSNTNGSITSQVSANTTAGFSVVTYTGTGSAATVGHGLGVAPSMVIIKDRDSGSNFWVVGTSSLSFTSDNYLRLNATSAVEAGGGVAWNNTAPTSTTVSIGNSTVLNANGNDYVMYAFAEVAGYSKFGSYVGNGSSTDGPFVYLGFRPRFVMIKCSSTGGAGYYWTITDTSRNTSNLSNLTLNPDTSNAEDNSYGMDILSNGFKIRNTYGTFNGSGATYIYACFAENPFKYSNAR